MPALRALSILVATAVTAFAGAGFVQQHRLPRFQDYPARVIYRGRRAPVDWSSDPDARRFRTRLRGAAEDGPRFGGHFGVAEWGCGSPCHFMGMVDLRTGRVVFAPVSATIKYAYRVDSRLLIVDPPEAWKDAPVDRGHAYYYQWTGRTFALVDSVAMTAR